MKKSDTKNKNRPALYLMPGMAASPKIFEYINVSDFFEVTLLYWISPLDNEPLGGYAKRMCKLVKHNNPILLGVSFGGILVQEMAKHIKCQSVVLVSAVKSNKEFSRTLKLSKKTKAHYLLPTQWIKNLESLSFFVFGDSIKRKVDLYKKYLSVRDPNYLKWAINSLVNWKQEVFDPKIIHIHGENDTVFPIANIIKTPYLYILPKGTHAIILTQYQWFNTELPKLLL